MSVATLPVLAVELTSLEVNPASELAPLEIVALETCAAAELLLFELVDEVSLKLAL
ncbi:hypothetical protein [Secundilactobacillus odoratitofui]|uniref:hypothetical protein n=1 Tax=Secundilactobacillus odoratitofui TaxID=480930 RepID=UPI002093D318|nr:hypothetical protein [Secundilactobacillus odoratitofui]